MSRGERYHVMWVHGQPTVYDSKEGAVMKTFRESEENDAEKLANELNNRIPYSHAADEHFVSLVDYLRHLVDSHGIEENQQLWRSGRERFDALHAEAHGSRGTEQVRYANE